jgi:hypothetical protein
MNCPLLVCRSSALRSLLVFIVVVDEADLEIPFLPLDFGLNEIEMRN